MRNLFEQMMLSLLFGCLLFHFVAPVVKADGRVFVVGLRNSSSLSGFRDAERACASHHGRLASAEELRHAVLECFFSPCTRGWLYGGTVGTTVCNTVGGALKAVDVRTENATEDAVHLDGFCIKDRDVPCGDPPSFPNARLQGHTGFELGDELLYTCAPGYVMPNGHSAFSLLCDSCGEWYGLVQICVKDEAESPVDYEDKFTDSYERHSEDSRPMEAQGKVYEEIHGAGGFSEGRTGQELQETSFKVEREPKDLGGAGGAGGERTERVFGRGKDEERAVEDFVGHPRWDQTRTEVDKKDAGAATDAPISLLSQKHLFWFPSETFQGSSGPVTQTTQRSSGAQSDESKEHESQESQDHRRPVDDRDHERDSYDPDDQDDHDDHDDHDGHDRDDHDDHDHDKHDVSLQEEDRDDHDSHQEEDDPSDQVKHYVPAQREDLDARDHYESHEDHDDHYDMGEHEDDRVRYDEQEYDDRDDTYDEQESYEDREDAVDDNDRQEHPDRSVEQPDGDHDDGEDDRDHDDGEDDRDHDDGEDDHDHDDHDDHTHDDHTHHDHDDHTHDDHDDHDDHTHDDHDNYDSHEDHDSREDDDHHRHVIFSIARDDRQNVSEKGEEEKATTDDTWLDGYPVAAEENRDNTAKGAVARATDRPDVVSKPQPYTDLPEQPGSSVDGDIAAPSPDDPNPSDSPSSSDTQQAAPTRSWHQDPTGPVLPGAMEEHTVHDLPGETGERGHVEGEMGETICTGESCPPRASSRGPTVAAIVAALCVVAAAVIIGVWCYRRQQQKSSMYEMNGKGQSQTRQGQQMEMQQKV